jgi:hypothetical protein
LRARNPPLRKSSYGIPENSHSSCASNFTDRCYPARGFITARY